jgi:hypothetical protein
MSRSSPCKDPSLWHGVVLDWLTKQQKKLAVKREKSDAQRLTADRPDLAGTPYVRSARFLRELPLHIERAKNSRESAGAVVAHFYAAMTGQASVDPLVVEYINQARERYCRDKSHDRQRAIEKALGLSRGRRGNPGRAATRLLTEEAFVEAGQLVMDIIDSGESVAVAIDDVLNKQLDPHETGEPSAHTLRRAMATEKRKRAERNNVMKAPYKRGNRKLPE